MPFLTKNTISASENASYAVYPAWFFFLCQLGCHCIVDEPVAHLGIFYSVSFLYVKNPSDLFREYKIITKNGSTSAHGGSESDLPFSAGRDVRILVPRLSLMKRSFLTLNLLRLFAAIGPKVL